ncbi:hypothetical protein OV320_2169 [Actinobacteria bacterium OV320]|nr:hypothetical protein OV320_2169 [Actinobacteria bacterium OV320]
MTRGQDTSHDDKADLMTTDATGAAADAADDWQQWHEGRLETVSAPYGPARAHRNVPPVPETA